MDDLNGIKKTKADWRLVIGILASIAVVVLIVLNVMNFLEKHSPESYDQILSGYYQAVAKNSTNDLALLTTTNFTDETSMLTVIPGKYIVFRYNYEELLSNNTINPSISNSERPFSKMLFSVSTTEDKSRVSYINEAYFQHEKGKIKLSMIKKLYTGKNITK